MASSYLDVPIFAGQGTDSLHSPQVLEQALRDASLPSSALLLSSCFDAFRTELSFLSPVQLQESGLEPTDFKTPTDILTISRHVHNPIISSTRLFLFQSVRYLAHVDGSNDSPTRFADAFKSNASCGNLGILGFSSGIIPACVVAASQSSLAYISNAVEAFRLVFWIGVRALGYRVKVLKGGGGDRLPWGAVFLGMDRKEAGAAIEAFQAKVLSRFQLLVAFDS